MKPDVIVVTGANNGICLSMTKTLVESGRRVVGLDLTGENLASLQRSNLDCFRFHDCDVTRSDEVDRAVQSTLAEWGTIDILVNGACIAIFAPFECKPLEDTRREFEVNYFGYLNLIRAVFPVMKANGHGVIHNFSSGVGITGFPGIYGYSSTKGAIEALTRTLAIEFRPLGITVNLIHPPLTRTKSASPLGVPDEMMADPQVVGRRLAGKIGSTADIITPDITTRLGLFPSRHFPEIMGRMLSSMTERSRKKTEGDAA
ncbi:MAG TPA: short-chain dehydrogenase [Nitrospiraceae bacterium]|nr:short-chain dehydrogenase [Nitrospiraceae bacterium]